jgi:(E)-4-hydroxy-3-methylbut-2-enyl-diphosphate synthase
MKEEVGSGSRKSGQPLTFVYLTLRLSTGRRETISTDNIGAHQVPVVVADLSKLVSISPKDLFSIGYAYDDSNDKWSIADTAADYVFTGHHILDFALPGTLKVIVYPAAWMEVERNPTEITTKKYFPIFDASRFLELYTGNKNISSLANFVMFDAEHPDLEELFHHLSGEQLSGKVVLCLSSEAENSMQSVRRMFIELMNRNISSPVIITVDSKWRTADEHMVHYATEGRALCYLKEWEMEYVLA